MSDLAGETEQLATDVREAMIALRTLVNGNEATNGELNTVTKGSLLEAVNELKGAIDSFEAANGATTFAALNDRETVDLPGVNTPLSQALASLTTALEGKSPTNHTHSLNEVVNLPEAIDDVNDNLAAHSGNVANPHQVTAGQLVDFGEAVDDRVAQLLSAGSSITLNYDDAGGEITISSTGGGGGSADPEEIRDVIGIALASVGLLNISINDAADTITFSTNATQNQTDAFLLALGNATGSLPQNQVTNLVSDLSSKATTNQFTSLETRVSKIELGYRAGSATNSLTAFAVGGGDGGTIVQTTSASAVTVTVNALAVDEVVVVAQGGAGGITFVAAGGVTLNAEFERTLVSPGQHSMVSLVGMPDGSILLMGGAAS